jgi:hypothetical protein
MCVSRAHICNQRATHLFILPTFKHTLEFLLKGGHFFN